MAKEHKEKSRGKGRERPRVYGPPEGELNKFSTLEAVHELAKYDARNTDTEDGLILFLKSWWSKQYNRPLKDPLLESYTLPELLYEYYDKSERALAAEEVIELNTDKIEAAQEEETMGWVEEEERKDREAEETEAKAKKEAEDEKWMLKQLKKEHGDDFGKDIDTDF